MDLFKIFSKELPSKDVARDRLKLILIHDRVNLSPQFLELIKGDIIRVISDYAVIDETSLEIKLAKVDDEGTDSLALIASIPIKKMKEMGR